MFAPLLSGRMTVTRTRKTAAQCSPLSSVWGVAPSSEAVLKILTVLAMLIWVMNPWQVTVPLGAVLPGVPTEGLAAVAVDHVPAALAEVQHLQLREQMLMMRMLAGRLH